VILDLLMPIADGFAVLEYLSRERPAMLQQVVILTAAVTPRDAERVRQYPVCAIIRKPFEVEALLDAVKRCGGEAGASRGGGALFASGVLLWLAEILSSR
jgi:DNA-binding NarL/FixJ family response regulator